MDFIKIRKITYILSLICVGGSLISMLFFKSFNYGTDFTGGIVIQVRFNEKVSENDIRQALPTGDFGNIVIQRVGQAYENLFIIKTRKEMMPAAPVTNINESGETNVSSMNISTVDRIQSSLTNAFGIQKVRLPFERVDEVGPKIGKELSALAFLLIALSFIGILIYVTIRFQFKFAVTSIIALVHDVTVLLGAFLFLEKEVDISTIAAVLFIIGYSINDTIVIFDRIRENLKLLHGRPLKDIINISITTTLTRTIITSFTTLLAAVSLFLWGGPGIHDFAFAFIVGIVVGSYSTIFIASALYYDWAQRPAKVQSI